MGKGPRIHPSTGWIGELSLPAGHRDRQHNQQPFPTASHSSNLFLGCKAADLIRLKKILTVYFQKRPCTPVQDLFRHGSGAEKRAFYGSFPNFRLFTGPGAPSKAVFSKKRLDGYPGGSARRTPPSSFRSRREAGSQGGSRRNGTVPCSAIPYPGGWKRWSSSTRRPWRKKCRRLP